MQARRASIALAGETVTGETDNRPNALDEADLRARLAAAYRTPEPDCVPPLIAEARLDAVLAASAASLAAKLVREVRAGRSQAFGVEALLQEFSLSSAEGVALMCLA